MEEQNEIKRQKELAIERFKRCVHVAGGPVVAAAAAAVEEQAAQVHNDNEVLEELIDLEDPLGDLLAVTERTPVTIPQVLYNQIIEKLNSGSVPPIYHALMMGRPCVAFRRNANMGSEKKCCGWYGSFWKTASAIRGG
jgi:hypothetical protein